MLKIKDDIDLKELEKFGFCLLQNENKQLYLRTKYGKQIYVSIDTREITQRYFNCYRRPVNEKFIKDLIQAELVE